MVVSRHGGVAIGQQAVQVEFARVDFSTQLGLDLPEFLRRSHRHFLFGEQQILTKRLDLRFGQLDG